MSLDDPFGTGDKLRKLREFHNYTQDYVSTQLGIKPNTLSDYEKGKVRVSREKLELAAKLFKVDVNLFFTQDPLTFNINQGSGANGYNVIHEQHNTDKALLDRMMDHIAERSKRLEDLHQETLAVLKQVLKERPQP